MYEASVLNYPVNVNLLSKWLGTITSSIMSSNIIKYRVSVLKYILESPAKDSMSSLIHEVRSRASARSLAKKQSQSQTPSQEAVEFFYLYLIIFCPKKKEPVSVFSTILSYILDYSKQDQRDRSVFSCHLITFNYVSYLLKEKNASSVLSQSQSVQSQKKSSNYFQISLLAVITTKAIIHEAARRLYLKMQIKWGCWILVIRIFRYSFATHTVVFHVLILVRIVSQSCCVTCTVMEVVCSLPNVPSI